jgi:hypothetical protein
MADLTEGAGGLVAAEVEYVSGRTHQAAAALRELGLRVLHIGPTISVSATVEVWERTFGLPQPAIPRVLRGLVTGIHLAGPPDLH